MKPRITKMSVLPDNCSIFEYTATHIAIDDEGAGEYVTITQHTDDRHGDHVVNINPDEWPAIRAAVNKMIKECKE